MKKKVLVTRRLPDEALRLLYDTCEVELNPYDRVMTKDELIEGIRDKEGILCLLTDTITAEVMDAAVHLKVISNYAVGFDNVDVKAATGRGIVVTNTPGVLTETSADLTWALLMATARRIVEADAFMRNGKVHRMGANDASRRGCIREDTGPRRHGKDWVCCCT